ncbi:MAG: hypothetical protein WCK77_13935 [Verrucomicrobiota bacterium]
MNHALLRAAAVPFAGAVEVDFSNYQPDCGIGVRQDGQHLEASWPAATPLSGPST